MAELWYSSDPHFEHANIIRYASRPFADVEEMREALIERHNAVVRPQDHWYCLGDFTMERGNTPGYALSLLKRLNGHKRLILGNHDHYHARLYLEAGFEKVMAMQMVEGIRLTHIPIHPGSMGNAIANAHGHIHQQPAPAPVIFDKDGVRLVKPYINLSVEAIHYTPVSLDQLKAMVTRAVDDARDVVHSVQ